MKQFIFILLTFFSINNGVCQLSKKDYQAQPVTWFGIDYTKVVLIGEEGFVDQKKIVDYYFNVWNSMVDIEPAKYDVAKFLLKESIKIDLRLVEKRNLLVDPQAMLGNEQKTVQQSEINGLLSQYDFSNYEGYGALLFAEFYDKTHAKASYAFVIFDVKTNQILMAKRYSAEPAGFGFRNYWAKTFFDTLEVIKYDVKKALK